MSMDTNERGFWMFAGCVIAALLVIASINFYQARHAAPAARELSYSQFLDELDHGNVRAVTLTGQDIQGSLADDTRFRSYAPTDPDLIRTLRQKNIPMKAVEAPAGSASWVSIVTALSPLLILIV